jgi:predicted alpha/beta hydrolase family esterase
MFDKWNRFSTNQKSSTKDKKIIGLQEIKGCDNPDRIGEVIFVHGLGGNLRSTWHSEELLDDNFWLNWLSQDQTDIGIWSFGYEAEPFEWRGKAMPLFDQASNLLEWLENKGLSERPLIFVTHSLGGLLVKKMLNTAQTFKKQKLIEQIKGIIFLATPHTGSHLANLIDNIGTLTRTTISVEELRSHATLLRELNEWYRENVRIFEIVTKVYFETRPIHGISVVDEDSANPGIEGVKPVAVPEDHITIAKPSSKNHLVYIGVARFILDNFKPYFNTSVSVSNDFTDESLTIDLADTIQTKRIKLRKIENDLKLLIEQIPRKSLQEEILLAFATFLKNSVQEVSLETSTQVNDSFDQVNQLKNLDMFTFCGIKKGKDLGKLEDTDALEQIYFLWADASEGSTVSAEVVQENTEKFIRIKFNNKSSVSSNVALRPGGITLIFRKEGYQEIKFKARIPSETQEADLNKVQVSIRVIDALTTHWKYIKPGRSEYYEPLIVESSNTAGGWIEMKVDLGNHDKWHFFDSDGNWKYRASYPEFTSILAIIVEVGSHQKNGHCPGEGQGIVDIKDFSIG